MSGSTQDTTTTTADTAATADQADAAETTGTMTADAPEAVAPEAEPAAPAKPWANTDSLDVHVKLEHLWAWAQDEMAKLHARIDDLMGGQGQNVEEPPPAKEA